MGKGVGTYNRLIRLHHKARGLTHHAARSQYMPSVNSQLQPKVVLARLHRHDNLFQTAVARTFPQTVDSALHLPSAADFHASERVGHGHAQVVMAVHRPDSLIGIRNAFAQSFNEIAIQFGDCIAHRVWNVDGSCSLCNDCLQNPA